MSASLLERDYITQRNMLDIIDDYEARIRTLEKQLRMGYPPSESGISTLGSTATAGAVTLTIDGLPTWVTANGCYAVIDAPSVECEVRKVNTVSGSDITIAATTYEHAAGDAIFFVWDPVINAHWFGAVGDDSTDNATALARWGTQAAGIGKCEAYLPTGIYQFSTKLDWSTSAYHGVSLVGDGPGSILKATAAITMMEIDAGDTLAANVLRQGRVQDIVFDGNSVANLGLYFGKAVMYQTRNVEIKYVTGTPGIGMIMDRSQNQEHHTLYIHHCDTDLVIMNGAANNNFYNLHLTNPNTYGLHIQQNTGYAGYDASDTNSGNQNSFYGGIIEPHATTGATAMAYLEHAERNLFSRFDFVRPATGNTMLIDISTDSPMNMFVDRCRMNAYNNAYEPLVRNSGDGTIFMTAWFSDPPSAMDAIQTGDGWMHLICNTFAADFVPVNVTSGTAYGRVRTFITDKNFGVTGDETNPGTGTGLFFYNEDLDMPTWRNEAGAVYYDALMNKIRLAKTELTIASGAVTLTRSAHTIDTEGDAATDDLDTITRSNDVSLAYIYTANGSRDVTLKHNTGNILCDGGADIVMDSVSDKVLLLWDEVNTKWCASKVVSI